MLQEFKKFVMRGNVLDLAVAVIIGAAFSKIVTSLTEDVLMPLIGRVFGGLDFSGYFLRLGTVPAGYNGSLDDYTGLKKAGVSLLGYGAFLTQVVNFLIVAFIIFLIVRGVNRALQFGHQEQVETKPAPDAADVVLLREILEELRRRPGGLS
jgi:large conductance mechanosensitive channel